jgi:outer membrane biosynthesis protein TonB
MKNKAKITAHVDLNDSTQVDALKIFLEALKQEPAATEKPAAIEKPAAKKAAPKKAKKAEPKEEPKEEAKEEAKEEVTSEIKIDDVRTQLSAKVNDNRDAIKQKLTDLGANNISSLDPAHYQELFDYLKAL